MIMNDVKAVDIAHRLGVTPTCVYLVRAGRGRSARVEKELAKCCGTTRDRMFPAVASAA
jgi:hypothetical protein